MSQGDAPFVSFTHETKGASPHLPSSQLLYLDLGTLATEGDTIGQNVPHAVRFHIRIE